MARETSWQLGPLGPGFFMLFPGLYKLRSETAPEIHGSGPMPIHRPRRKAVAADGQKNLDIEIATALLLMARR